MARFIILLAFLLPYHASYAEKNEIILWKTDSGIIFDTLQRALDLTKKEYGDYRITLSEKMVQNRALRELSNKNFDMDIGYFISTAEREKQALVIRVPIMKGLLGYRICLIKEADQEKFNGISNKQQWIEKNITIGQHENWPDTEILKNNGFDVKTTFKRELLYQQLAKDRFDCFARGANEIQENLLNNGLPGLVIEKNMLIHYPFPLFFYVSPDKPQLAERMQLGLTRLHESGIADQMFKEYFGEVLFNLAMQKRQLIELENATLSQQTLDVLADNKYMGSEKAGALINVD